MSVWMSQCVCMTGCLLLFGYCLDVYLFRFLDVLMSIWMPLWISGRLNVCLAAGMLVCMSEYFNVWMFFFLFILIFGCLDVHLDV